MTSYNTYKDIGQSKHVLAFLVQLSETATRHQANAAQVLATCKYLRDHFATNRETMEHGLTGALVELYKTPPSPLTESVLSLALYRGSTRGELIHIFSVVVSYLETEGGSELAESFATILVPDHAQIHSQERSRGVRFGLAQVSLAAHRTD